MKTPRIGCMVGGFLSLVLSLSAQTFTVLHSFDGTDGEFTAQALVQDTNGKFYGTTPDGGAKGDGTVFSLSVGLGPFVETQPTSGKVGSAVKILGTNLTGATSVTFNGTAAVFKLVSASLITANIPTGATTGTVEVKTPKGTLKSNVAFLMSCNPHDRSRGYNFGLTCKIPVMPWWLM